MTEDVELNGDTITVHAEEVRKGRWTWWFMFKGKMVKCPDRPIESDTFALNEAKHEALEYLKRG